MDPSRVIPRERRPSETKGNVASTPNATDLDRWEVTSEIQTEISKLQTNIHIIDQDLSELSRLPRSVRFALLQTRKHIDVIEEKLALLVDQIPPPTRTTADSAAKAQQVFAIPELLEQILVHCNSSDLVVVRGVNRVFAGTISQSTKIQEALGLRPRAGGSPFSPFVDTFFVLRGLVVRMEELNRHVLDSTTVELTATFNTSDLTREVSLPRLGEYWRRMLVLQPPIQSMRIRTSKCSKVLRLTSRHER